AGVLQLPGNPGLVQEAVREPPVLGPLRAKLLEGHFAVEVAVVSEPDAADAPGGVQPRQRVAPAQRGGVIDRPPGGGCRRVSGRLGGLRGDRTAEWGGIVGRRGSGTGLPTPAPQTLEARPGAVPAGPPIRASRRWRVRGLLPPPAPRPRQPAPRRTARRAAGSRQRSRGHVQFLVQPLDGPRPELPCGVRRALQQSADLLEGELLLVPQGDDPPVVLGQTPQCRLENLVLLVLHRLAAGRGRVRRETPG